jgi:DNA-directed RNA polymerase subunit RPC12/RpoP
MSNNYPEGSMKGSGIDSVEVELYVECPHCGSESEQSFNTDDYHRVDEEVTCPNCKHTFNFESPND